MSTFPLQRFPELFNSFALSVSPTEGSWPSLVAVYKSMRCAFTQAGRCPYCGEDTNQTTQVLLILLMPSHRSLQAQMDRSILQDEEKVDLWPCPLFSFFCRWSILSSLLLSVSYHSRHQTGRQFWVSTLAIHRLSLWLSQGRTSRIFTVCFCHSLPSGKNEIPRPADMLDVPQLGSANSCHN